MVKKEIATSEVHKVPADLKEALVSNPDVLKKWNSLTPLACNECICWATIVKKPETRKDHINRLCADLLKGKRRTCFLPRCRPPRRKTKK